MTEEKETAALAQVMMDYLDCPCRYFLPQEDSGAILAAWEEARRRGDREGFFPVLVTVTETLWETLRMNAGDDEDDLYRFDPAQVKEYRRKILAGPTPDFGETLERYRAFCPSSVQQRLREPAPAALP